MELRALKYFVTVAEELHFGRAAERLHIAQPAVSQQIARLERELGVQLLDRSPRQVQLTAAGHRVLSAARDALASADKVRSAAGKPMDVLRIGTAAGLTGRLERGIDALRERAPHFTVELVDLPVAQRLTALRSGAIDLALARGVHTAPGLTVIPTWTEPLLAVVSRHHPAAERAAVRISDLAGSALRIPSDKHDPPLHDAVITALRDSGACPPPGRTTGTTPDTIVEVGSDPHSWTLLPADQIAETGSTRVAAIPLDPPLSITGSVIVGPGVPDRSAGCAVQAFRDAAV